MKRKTKLEIIEETAAFYMEDPSRRAVRDTPGPWIISCSYHDTVTGKECAVGRCLIDSEAFEADFSGSIDGGGWTVQEDLDPYFKEEYRGHNDQFWGGLQAWHDCPRYWEKEGTGLTPEGEKFLAELKETYS